MMTLQDEIISEVEDKFDVTYDDVQPESSLCCGQEPCIDAYRSQLSKEFEKEQTKQRLKLF